MTYKENIGKTGEDIAYKYLKSNGYKIIDRNYRQKWGEIDIIALEPNKTLVFVEVKTLQNVTEFLPEENLSKSKLIKLQRTASLYANNHPELVDNDKGWRIDLIAIDLTNNKKDCNIRYYDNI